MNEDQGSMTDEKKTADKKVKAQENVDDKTWLNIPSLLYAIIRFFAFLISLAVSLIAWTFTKEFMDIFNNTGIYTGWQTVRDVLNMFFIFFLIYSAFCTIFQISRYHIRSTWVMIVVMALLVNFSWPISRILIDMSNMTMSWMLGSDGGNKIKSDGLMSQLGEKSEFAKIIIGKKKGEKVVLTGSSTEYQQLFLGIVTAFLFLVTVGAIAFLFVIRIIALAVLLVFASAGFALAAFPSTASQANKWWSAFTKYLFAGPLLLFVLLLSVSILSGMATDFGKSAEGAVKGNVANTSTGVMFLQYIVTLVILWTGLLTAGAMGDGASSIVLSGAGKVKGWAQNKVKQGAWGSTKFVGRRADIVGGHLSKNLGDHVEKWSGGKTRLGLSGRAPSSYVRNIGERWKNMGEADKKKYAGYVEESKAAGLEKGGPGGDKGARTAYANKKVAELKKKYKDENVDVTSAMRDFSTATGHEQRALAEYLAEHKEFGKGDDSQYQTLQQMLSRQTTAQNRLADNIRTALEKKLSSEGKGHVVLSSRMASGQYVDQDAAYNHMFAKMSGQDIGKQETLVTQMRQGQNFRIRQLLQQRINGNQRLANQIRDNASGQFVADASAPGGILT
ncbi:MAG: hypothetical protein WC819_06705 [Parcubacteria group bacterium]